MSQEVLEIVQGMDRKNIETQLALQCAPLIAGLKTSNLLIVHKMNLHNIRIILKQTDISYKVLLILGDKITLLLFRANELEAYLSTEAAVGFLMERGYERLTLSAIVNEFQTRYRKYMEDGQSFPHEMGLLLGYPLEDVKGFVENQGRDALCIGYWKVYRHPAAKQQLFSRFELAKETMIQLLSNGVSMVDIIDIYRNERLQRVAV